MTDAPALAGMLLIDKPAGWTSMDVCASIRARLRRAGAPKRVKVGHAGTLDPMATGLLVVLIGKATRLCDAFMAAEKTYETDIDLSRTSDTDDAEGRVTPVDVPSPPTQARVLDAMAALTGRILQRPPAYSAVHVGGRRAYAMAREGRAPDLPARPVEVREFRLDSYQWPIARATIRCGKGTYIRSLARDLGAALGTGGMLVSLRRTRAGAFSIDAARTMDALPDPLTPADLSPVPHS